MTESKDEYKTPIFDGHRSSFQLWKAKVLMMLDARDLEEYATGSISSSGDHKPIMLTSDEHLRKSKKTKSLLCLCLSDDILSTVIDFETAHDVFKELCSS
jgi:hypothetical protein